MSLSSIISSELLCSAQKVEVSGLKLKKQKQVFQWHTTLEKDYEIFYYLNDEDYFAPLHSHDFYEFYFLISGNIYYQIMDTCFLLRPGDVLLINIDKLHCPIAKEPMMMPYERIVLRVSHDVLASLSSEKSDLTECFRRDKYAVYHFPPEIQNNIRVLLSKLLGVQSQPDFGNELIYKAYLTELLVLANRCCRGTPPLTLDDSEKKFQTIEMVNHYINENLEKNITVDELAEHVYLSKYYFMRLFKEMTGTSVHQYIIQKRLLSACNMIMNGASITAAYQQCGFGDYSCFFRAFKKHFGYPPKQYTSLK